MTQTGIDFEFKSTQVRPGITLLHHRSSKWKTEVMKLVFLGDLRQNLAERALGAYLLRHGHGKKKGMELVARFMQDLCGASLGSFVTKSFGNHLLVLRGSTIAAQYAPGKVDPLALLLGYVSELLSDPYLARKDFSAEDFQREKRNLLRAIASQADNKGQYANQRMIETMFPNHPFGQPAFGRPEEVALLEPEGVAQEIRSLVENQPLMIYVVSPRKTSELKKILATHLKLGARKEFKANRITQPPLRRRMQRVDEYEDLTQGRLAMGYRIEDYKRRSDAHAAILGDMLLGGVSSSRLFREVREKRSLAYSVGSGLDASTGVCAVSAGVDPKNVEQVIKLVRAQVKALANERFTKDDLQPIFATFRKHFLGLSDSPDGMINFNLAQVLSGRKESTPSVLLDRYLRVKPDRIAKVMDRMRLDTIFTLAPSEVTA
ncbi:MAG: putative Zn-dependent peptidase [Planctomycetota bacterium]